ncbi:hypothetical protein [Pseudarthrobacter oxydans]|uniref:hypothetical protein n=1 Tax=Pseudarthrobacter oxydans TaxID=1671 RepID=UPI0038187387
MTLSNQELLDHLAEQLLFVDSSCTSYDVGATYEAKRLATHVRVLLHDTNASTSLLKYLGLKDKMNFIDGVPAHFHEAAKRAGTAVFASIGGLAVIRQSADSISYVPTFTAGGLEPTQIPFSPWWTEARMIDPQGNQVSRKQIVLWLANKDGGAHIDKLPPTYQALTKDGSMGLSFHQPDGTTTEAPSPIPAAMRQIAEEVRVSVRQTIGA